MPEVQISDELERRRRNLPEDGNNEGIQAQVQIVGQVAAKQTKKEGVRYPNSRNSKYGSEIRPAGWKQKIWLGSFESEDETMRAYDAALHAIGKVPVHYAYPPGHHKPIRCNWKDQELVLQHVKSMEGSHFDAFKKEVTAKAKCASTSRALFPLVKDVVDLVLCDLPGPLPGAMDWMVPLCEEIDSEDVGERPLVLGIEMVPEDDSAMPLHQQLCGIHSSIVAPEENIMADGG
ncbi:hypothetical protein CY35_11G102500 [Sphagnum magellanicum]|nr:hypothetical protein CY35_11G102500 [Sphagnum magellanicum]